MTPSTPSTLAAEVERLEIWVAGRNGLMLRLGLLAAMLVSVAGLIFDGGFPWPLAILCAVVVWVGIPMAGMRAWLKPHKYTGRHLLRVALALGLLSYGGAVVGFLAVRMVAPGGIGPDPLWHAVKAAGTSSLPALVMALTAVLLMMWVVAQIRSTSDRHELARLKLVQERDAAARHAAEARLNLLQAQIQPHFIFNTLAALQHWVDSGDVRAGPLLRTLTAFLRSSTELMGQTEVTLDVEADIVRQYLQIMQARLGDRLRFEVDIGADCRAATLPPGLVLTLVENAIEHGISPALAGGTVSLSAARDGDEVVIRVRDDGVGLGPQWQDGIGLANCRERLRHHGAGTLEVRAQSTGTEAVLRLREAR